MADMIAIAVIGMMTTIASAEQVDPVRLPCRSPNMFDGSKCLFAGASCNFNADFSNFNDKSMRYHEYITNPNPARADFIIESGFPVFEDGALRLSLVPPEGYKSTATELTGTKAMGTATIISTSRFLQYGTFEARLRSSGTPGVVTTFIGFSNDQDEIDVECTGFDDNNVQANWYYRGYADKDPSNGASVNGFTGYTKASNSENYYTYTVNWTNETITWMIDGELMHEVSRLSSGAKGFPDQPMRISFGLWQTYPGLTWAGLSDIKDWSRPISAYFQSLRINCLAGPDQESTSDDSLPGQDGESASDDSLGPPSSKESTSDSDDSLAGEGRESSAIKDQLKSTEPGYLSKMDVEESKSSSVLIVAAFVLAIISTLLLLG